MHHECSNGKSYLLCIFSSADIPFHFFHTVFQRMNVLKSEIVNILHFFIHAGNLLF